MFKVRLSFTRRGSFAMCWGGVDDLSTLADFAPYATTVMQCGPHAELEQMRPPTNLCTRLLFMYVYASFDFYM